MSPPSNTRVLPPSSVGEMTLRLYSALSYSQNSACDLPRALKWSVSASFAKGCVHITNSKQRKHQKTHDQNPNRGPDVGNDAGSEKAGRGMVQVDCRSRGEGDEADGPVHHSRNWKTREGATKGAQGTQPPDRRTDSNPEKDGSQVSSSESLPGRRRLTEEVAHKRRLGMSYRTTDARWRRARRKKRAKADTENPTETKALQVPEPHQFGRRSQRAREMLANGLLPLDIPSPASR